MILSGLSQLGSEFPSRLRSLDLWSLSWPLKDPLYESSNPFPLPCYLFGFSFCGRHEQVPALLTVSLCFFLGAHSKVVAYDGNGWSCTEDSASCSGRKALHYSSLLVHLQLVLSNICSRVTGLASSCLSSRKASKQRDQGDVWDAPWGGKHTEAFSKVHSFHLVQVTSLPWRVWTFSQGA